MLINPKQAILIADALDEVERQQSNHVSDGGIYTDADYALIFTLSGVLRSMARRGVNADLLLRDMGAADLLDGGHLFHQDTIASIPGATEALSKAGAS